MKKALVWLLAVLMLASLLAGCANNNDPAEDTTKTEEQSNVLDNLNVPDKKYNGKEFMFLTRDAAEWTTVDIYSAELDDDPINSAVYRRNDAIGTPFCVTFDFDSLEDHCVTVRNRDTMQQERVAIDKLADYVKDAMKY